MKPYTYAFLAAAAACGLASAAETAYTTPVGYVSLGNAAAPALPQETDIAISVPLLQTAEFAGTVSSVAGNVITITGTPSFVVSPGVGSWAPSSGVPYIVQIGSGAQSGVIGLITSNDASTITVSLQSGLSLSGVVAGDKLSIRKATTLSNLFAGNTLVDGLELQLFDAVPDGINLASSSSVVYIAGDWYDSSSNIVNNLVLYPGEGLVLRNSATGFDQTSLVVSGEVSVADSKIVVSKLSATSAQDNRVSFIGAGSQAIGDAGFNASALDGDEFIFFDNNPGINKSGESLTFIAGDWYDASSNIVNSTFFLEAGRSYIYRREASGAVGDVVVSATPSYVPSL